MFLRRICGRDSELVVVARRHRVKRFGVVHVFRIERLENKRPVLIAIDFVAIDHVGIASDFDGGGGIDGWQDASETFAVTAELVKRGYSEEDIGKIWGGNLLRVMEAVEVEAAK